MDKILLLDDKQYYVEKLLEDMANDEFYYGFCGKNMLSSSAIKSLLDGSYFDKSIELSKSTKDAFKAGRLLHMAFLEREKLDELAIIAECKTRASKIYKDLVLEHGEDYVWTRNQWDKMEGITAKLKADRPELLEFHVLYEESGVALINGLPFRGKADMISLEKKTIIDLKTTSRLSHFGESAIKFDYDIQLYIYCNMFGIVPTSFYWLALEKSTGDSEYFVGTDDLYHSGKEKTERAIDIFIEHKNND